MQIDFIILINGSDIIKKTKCIICKKEFEYKNYKKKCCSNKCLSIYRAKLTKKQHNINPDELINKIEEYIVENYKNNNRIVTLRECLKELHTAPKTYYKYSKLLGISFNELLEKNGIKPKYSKFQHNINQIIKEIFRNEKIIFEKTFHNCRNIETNYKLRFDIYIPSKNLIIECDGNAHINKNNYYNKLTLKSGYTPTYITDKIKNNYCKENNIKLVRIPYKKGIISKKYVLSFL